MTSHPHEAFAFSGEALILCFNTQQMIYSKCIYKQLRDTLKLVRGAREVFKPSDSATYKVVYLTQIQNWIFACLAYNE